MLWRGDEGEVFQLHYRATYSKGKLFVYIYAISILSVRSCNQFRVFDDTVAIFASINDLDKRLALPLDF